MRRMLVAVVSMTLVVSVLAAPSVTAGGRRTTYAMTDCRHLRTAPKSILFACGDGNFFVDHLTWFRWHPWKAVAAGCSI